MQALNEFFLLIDGYIGGSPWFVYLLLGTGLFFTLYLKFPQVRYFRHAFDMVRGKYDEAGAKGDTTHFRALTTALSGTVGTGNIAGVALAIHLGGPAALFWMLVTAALGMTTKFVEVTLSHKYREFTADGSAAGGPMYYMKNRLNMKWMAVLFALATIISSFGTGNMPQINSISNSMDTAFGIHPAVTGLILSVLLAMIILGGIKRIAAVTSRLVPLMAVVYFFGALSVIFYNAENIVPSINAIASGVFTGSSATGGFLGATLAYAINRGVNRGLFSNEAGQGSAPIAHAAAKADHPVSEGMVAILEPFIDTIIICTLTGLVLLSSGVWMEKHQNQFQRADIIFLDGAWDDTDDTQRAQLSRFLDPGRTSSASTFDGTLQVMNGRITGDATLMHARSLAEDVLVHDTSTGAAYSGELVVENGRIFQTDGNVSFEGRSLVHSAPLTTIAFSRGYLGDLGAYIIPISLLMFAFSTAIAWSYYGDRAVTFLWGVEYVRYYRIVYVAGFFAAAVIDTTIIWTFSGIAIALMTIPNIIGILLLHREMKDEVKNYWDTFDLRLPDK
ncbi:MAG: amino acid carrier protein [Xanthomonadales bacterium]|nr:amino acid carrier protein [Gammaproteobacteria bacterium]MBT8051643.1 amino acid carrier protein [Gammaproteobacteria bacterium]MBT8057660.1 amino acid carrier protein [Gammaproteobacteria bacterium]NNJ77748.1 amino acid carrier protein [Xanthomonadales bacterium]NNL04951.1 amino acid carrier protein [Xanthomonadales bacterium]